MDRPDRFWRVAHRRDEGPVDLECPDRQSLEVDGRRLVAKPSTATSTPKLSQLPEPCRQPVGIWDRELVSATSTTSEAGSKAAAESMSSTWSTKPSASNSRTETLIDM